MEWIKCTDKLPKVNRRYLGYCYNEFENTISWNGVVEVFFDPSIGWRRCENYDTKPVRVIYWAEFPDIPRDEI